MTSDTVRLWELMHDDYGSASVVCVMSCPTTLMVTFLAAHEITYSKYPERVRISKWISQIDVRIQRMFQAEGPA